MRSTHYTRLGLALLLILACKISLANENTGSISRCAGESNENTRLACYDRLARSLGFDPSNEGRWIVHSSRTALSGTVVLTLAAQEPVKSRTQTVTPSLQISCSNAETQVQVNWGVYLGKNSTNMLTRFNEEESKTTKWTIAEDNRTVKYRGKANEFVYRLQQRQKLITGLSPYNADPIAATFDIGGFAKALTGLHIDCGW